MELSIQKRLKDLRVERDLTLEQLAEQFPESSFKDVSASTRYYAYMLRAVGYVK